MGLWNETLSKSQTCSSLTSWVEIPTNHGQNHCQMQTSVNQNLVLANLKESSQEKGNTNWEVRCTRENQRLVWASTNILFLILSMIQIPQPCMGSENDVMVPCPGSSELPSSSMVLRTSSRPHVSYLKLAQTDSLQLESESMFVPIRHSHEQRSQLTCMDPSWPYRNVCITFLPSDNKCQLRGANTLFLPLNILYYWSFIEVTTVLMIAWTWASSWMKGGKEIFILNSFIKKSPLSRNNIVPFVD